MDGRKHKTTSYVGGGDIPLVEDNTAWSNLADDDENVSKAYCFYDTDGNSAGEIYGALYTYAAATNGDNTGTGVQGVCPTGWHMPSDDEWDDLETELGDVAGGKLKSTCMELWNSSNTGATNESGFSALPGGYHSSSYGSFDTAGNYGYWWSATQYSGSSAWLRNLYYGYAEVGRYDSSKSLGFSVRCLRD